MPSSELCGFAESRCGKKPEMNKSCRMRKMKMAIETANLTKVVPADR